MRFESLLLLILLGPLAAQAGSEVPPEHTQSGMNAAASERVRAAESEMAAVLGALEGKSQANPPALAALRQSQAAWVAYRDAQLQVPWAPVAPDQRGSVYPMCVADLQAVLTEARIRELRALLTSQEGDVCASGW
jgi:uncharacterized protein YecT (DUF1311 family)